MLLISLHCICSIKGQFCQSKGHIFLHWMLSKQSGMVHQGPNTNCIFLFFIAILMLVVQCSRIFIFLLPPSLPSNLTEARKEAVRQHKNKQLNFHSSLPVKNDSLQSFLEFNFAFATLINHYICPSQ